MREETQAARLGVNVAALQQEGTLITQRKFTVLTMVDLLAVAVTDVARSGTLEFEFDADTFTSSTTLTNGDWGLRLGGPFSAVDLSAAEDGCEVSESVVSGTTGSGFFAAPFNIDALVDRDRESRNCLYFDPNPVAGSLGTVSKRVNGRRLHIVRTRGRRERSPLR